MVAIEMHDQTAIISREEKLNRLIKLYGRSLVRTCYMLLKDASMAEDATQESLIKAYNSFDTFTSRDASSEKAWLTRIAVNICKDMRRSAWYRNVDRRLDIHNVLESKQSDMVKTLYYRMFCLYHSNIVTFYSFIIIRDLISRKFA